MQTSSEFIGSGILELYVLGIAGPEDIREVEQMAAIYPEVREEIAAISASMEQYAMAHALPPDATGKPFLLATIDYAERLKNGEAATIPPLLHERAAIADYALWLNRPDMTRQGTGDIYAKIIGYTPEVITAIVWLKDIAPQEVHHDEYERFLIVEGTCNIIVDNEVNQLSPGDYFAIPLHKTHAVKVTSDIACKVILQRVAA